MTSAILQKIHHAYLNDKDIKTKYSNNNLSITYSIELADSIIFIYDHIEKIKPSISKINSFIQSVNLISKSSQKKCIGICISDISCNDSIKNILTNIPNTQNISIINTPCSTFINILYEHEVYTYDSEGCCIMLT